MSLPRLMRRQARPLLTHPKSLHVPNPPLTQHHHHQTRPFSLPDLSSLTLPTTPRTLRAARTLPYPPALLYAIISDIPSYATFLPFCTSSVVHAWTPTSPRHPSLATLTVGWGPFAAESYTSRVYCVPGRTVEAVSGQAGPSTSWEVLRGYGYEEGRVGGGGGAGDRRAGDGDLFKSLVTKWTVTPVEGRVGSGGEQRTDVDLRIDYLLANPIHQVAVGGVADQVADKMIRAFESRAEKLYSTWRRRDGEAR
ncbi:hypothetical protein CONLIGDRAFT_330938 [Coniochaeta ligniaria NRRL 30616]|uniref:Coenzyme Q-binding protein COQ10 START domain-containing protein n=1 Tax=Coniochaeta ligniaria NRRL 30616 TaxID=1408157 RepID=A0A1J7IPF2_9PEZI|nr:hypothetical protein CONLIGDRAFT_330938 [Coniochaeta ligniaria NRRL 30616]